MVNPSPDICQGPCGPDMLGRHAFVEFSGPRVGCYSEDVAPTDIYTSKFAPLDDVPVVVHLEPLWLHPQLLEIWMVIAGSFRLEVFQEVSTVLSVGVDLFRESTEPALEYLQATHRETICLGIVDNLVPGCPGLGDIGSNNRQIL
jgi:hypothetical protein